MAKNLMTGNEAVARGLYEAGVAFASAYPGTPSTEILENVAEKYKDTITCEWAPNEKVAFEAAVGASFVGGRSFAAMKHVGLNVAADPLLTFAYTGVNGGMCFVSADDPGLHSSQNEQDNRFYARMGKIMMLEPSDSQEAKDMAVLGYELSEQFDTPVMLRMTTRVCHSKSLVEFGEVKAPEKKEYVKNRAKFDPVPAMAKGMHSAVEKRWAKLLEYTEVCPLNREEWHTDEIGIVSAGVAYQYAREVFGDNASYFKCGMTSPMPIESIKKFAAKIMTKFGENKKIVGVVGDSTFFHTGMNSMLDAVYNHSNVTLIVVDNRITGMTGHQENPGSGYTITGEHAYPADIEGVARAFGMTEIYKVNPMDLEATRKALKAAIEYEGPSLVITRYPCALKKRSPEDKAEFGTDRTPYAIDAETCIGCKSCLRLGCPAISFDAGTKKAKIDRVACAGCGVCAQVCPKKAMGKVGA